MLSSLNLTAFFSQSSVSSLSFGNDSLSFDCSDIFVSEVSQELFKGKKPQTLSSNFVNFNSFVYYAVKNSKGAVVGQVVTDGIVVNFGSETIQSGTICLQISSSTSLSDDYPVLDFAYRYASPFSFCFLFNICSILIFSIYSNADYSSLTPIELDVTNEGGQLCANVQQVSGMLFFRWEGQVEKKSIFPIHLSFAEMESGVEISLLTSFDGLTTNIVFQKVPNHILVSFELLIGRT